MQNSRSISAKPEPCSAFPRTTCDRASRQRGDRVLEALVREHQAALVLREQHRDFEAGQSVSDPIPSLDERFVELLLQSRRHPPHVLLDQLFAVSAHDALTAGPLEHLLHKHAVDPSGSGSGSRSGFRRREAGRGPIGRVGQPRVAENEALQPRTQPRRRGEKPPTTPNSSATITKRSQPRRSTSAKPAPPDGLGAELVPRAARCRRPERRSSPPPPTPRAAAGSPTRPR